MILPDTPPEEIFRIISEEEPKLLFALDKEFQRAEKKFTHSQSLPVLHQIEYTVPSSRNRYLVWMYAFNEYQKTVKPMYGFALMVNGLGGSVEYYTLNHLAHKILRGGVVTESTVNALSKFIPHYLSRYRERFIKDESLSPEKLAVTYFGRNQSTKVSEEVEKINILAGKDDKYRSYRLRDGVALVEKEERTLPDGRVYDFNIYKTFLSEDMLKGSQEKALSNSRGKLFIELTTIK